MKKLIITLLTVGTFFFLTPTACGPKPSSEENASEETESQSPEESEIDEETKAAVQNAMVQHIENQLASNDGFYSIEDSNFEYDYLHDGLKIEDGLYVSCADFKSGEMVNDVDIYVKEQEGNYVVVKEVLHKKNGEEVNEVIWEKK